jgi:hypothetical protein
MSKEYSVEVCRQLEAGFHAAKLFRPMRISRYDAGTELTYDVSGVGRAETAKVHMIVEKFVGGGFAGQVYRVKVTGIEGVIEGLEVDKVYAIKILIPPSGLASRGRFSFRSIRRRRGPGRSGRNLSGGVQRFDSATKTQSWIFTVHS